jgi:tetratricopeptide (TPR) repeat protein
MKFVVYISGLLLLLSSCSVLSGGREAGSEEAAAIPDSLQVPNLADESPQRIRFERKFFGAQQEKLAGNKQKAIEAFRKVVADFPRQPSAQYELGRLLLGEGQYAKAEPHLLKAHQLMPENTWYAQSLAEAYRSQDKYIKAAQVYRELIELDQDNPKYHYELANMYIVDGKLEKAIEAYNEMEKVVGVRKPISFQKAKLYLRMDQPAKAASEIQTLIDAYPTKIEYYERLASIYKNNNKIAEAIDIYEDILDKQPNNGTARLALAQLYQRTGKTDKAQDQLLKAFANPQLDLDAKVKLLYNEYLRTKQRTASEMAFGTRLAEVVVETHPEQAKAHALLGDFLYNSNQSERALPSYRQSVELDPSVFAVWRQILFIHASEGQYQEMAQTSSRVIELFPNQPLGFYFYGFSQNQLGNYKEAVEALETGVSITVDNPDLKSQMYTNLAEAHHHLAQYEQSDAYFDKSLDINPNDPTTLNNYAYYLSVRGDQLDKAANMSKRSMRIGGENPSFLDTYGWIQYRMGNYQAAEEYIGKALDKSGGSAEVLHHYGDVLYELGRKQDALKYWRKALDAGGSADELEPKIRRINP